MKNKNNKKNNLPLILIILDGWGLAKKNKGNAVELAKTPTMDGLIKKYPNTTLCASGKRVGLPPKQTGNSEAGHMNIGAGRIIEQDIVKISKSINEGVFFKNAAFVEAIEHVKKNKSALHLMGMLSNGMSAHSDPDHMMALITLAREHKVDNIYLHLFTDGRDSPQYISLKLIEAIQRDYLKKEKIATIMGRFFAMDRKKKWERTERAYNALVLGEGIKIKSPQAAITQSYNKGENDEFIQPYVMRDGQKINNNDSVIFFNLRSDRARQLAKVFVQKNFNKMNKGAFKRKKVLKNLKFVTMTDFGPDLDNILTAYPGSNITETLPMILHDLHQLYISETEKYAHVTYFFNGGYDNPIDGESRYVVPSPDVKSYDETPSMSSSKLSKKVIHDLKNKKYDFTVLNFAAPDMVAHTGNLEAGIKCCHMVDKYLGKIVKAYLKEKGTILVTSDHGNIEEMVNLKTGEIDTEHSINPVPFILVNNELKNTKLINNGILADIAPTILKLLNYKKPKEMTGKSLIK
ncbi:MAG: 2,3-bisphosphoglycerate-independent phosphoglycerate mutase [Candidatus Falkowbacteria bacterium]